MKRVVAISGESGFGSDARRVSIRVTVSVGKLDLTRDELETAVEMLADDAMRSLSSARYVSVPLSKQRVR